MAGKAVDVLPHEPLAIIRGDEIIEKPKLTAKLQLADKLIMVLDEQVEGLFSHDLEQ